ncbi:MAG: transporter substrate-binding domain-containing protein [Pseudomonadota bacterium]
MTRESPLAYFKNETGNISGLEADLCSLFAVNLGVKVEFILADSIPGIFELLRTGQADMAAANLIRTPDQYPLFRFGSSYMKLRQQLLMREDADKPRRLDDIDNAYISVVAGSGHNETALAISERNPDIVPQALNASSGMELVAKLARKELDYVLIDASMAHWAQMRFPEVKLALDVGEPKDYAWVFSASLSMCKAFPRDRQCKGRDNDSLVHAAETFLKTLKQNGELQRIIDGYFDYIDTLDPSGSRQFLRAVRYQLPAYRPHFMQAGKRHGVDWRLLAATGYQESKWDPDVVSDSGPRGMMQFTSSTAQRLGIDPHDPRSSIEGAARYLKILDQQLPGAIPPNERPWFSLAAYNIGIGTVLHALRTYQRKHPRENLYWQDFKESLLQEAQSSGFSQQRRKLALHYVDSVRSYYELLIWLTERSPEVNADGKLAP